MSVFRCPAKLVIDTIDHLQAAGRGEKECIVLWLGRRCGDDLDIQEACRPLQRAQRDRFHIPSDEMTALKTYLREHYLFIAAQVHSHPAEAFHSIADDVGAVIRHVGALSFVVPWFARRTTVSSFLSDAVLFELQMDNTWLEIPFSCLETKCRIIG